MRDHLDRKSKLQTSCYNLLPKLACFLKIPGKVKDHLNSTAATVPELPKNSQVQFLDQSRQDRCCYNIVLKHGRKVTLITKL